jgi:hypothetical protein
MVHTLLYSRCLVLVVLVSVCIARNETRVGSKHHARMLGNKHSSDQKSDAGPGPASHYISGTTGVLFTGEKVRKYDHSKSHVNVKKLTEKKHKKNGDIFGHGKSDNEPMSCTKWSVVTTIFEISEGIRRTLQVHPEWCTVVVTDRKTPVESYQGHHHEKLRNLVLLTVEEQEVIAKKSRFVASTPWNHFARKNIGFLYAISRGAQYIFDVDDDNELKMTNTGAVSPLPEITQAIDVVAVNKEETRAFNPYPMFHSTNPAAWPRGFPFSNITQEKTYQAGRKEKGADFNTVAVFQSLADHDPDVDAIYRLTQRQLHFNFKSANSDEVVQPVAIPAGIYTPYNAQATVHCPSAYMFMLLPISVPGRVSDIWRSYFTQRLLWDLGKVIAFTAPIVAQERTAHNYLKDFDAEQDLYYKTNSLIDFLSTWSGSHLPTMQERMEHLYVELYERSFIELSDLKAVHEWLETLTLMGYEFPTPVATMPTVRR